MTDRNAGRDVGCAAAMERDRRTQHAAASPSGRARAVSRLPRCSSPACAGMTGRAQEERRLLDQVLGRLDATSRLPGRARARWSPTSGWCRKSRAAPARASTPSGSRVRSDSEVAFLDLPGEAAGSAFATCARSSGKSSVARRARRWPIVLDALGSGRVASRRARMLRAERTHNLGEPRPPTCRRCRSSSSAAAPLPLRRPSCEATTR